MQGKTLPDATESDRTFYDRYAETLALLGKNWIAAALEQPVSLVALLTVLCAVILAAAVAIVHHADVLAHRLGRPAGTLLLTLAITGLEVAMVAFVMSTGADKPALALTPESIAAVRAAMANRVQRSVNILLGSVLASIGLTIPLVIAVSLITGRPLLLGLDAVDTVMLVLTLATSTLTFSLPRTNVLFGCVHLLLFGAHMMLMFERCARRTLLSARVVRKEVSVSRFASPVRVIDHRCETQ